MASNVYPHAVRFSALVKSIADADLHTDKIMPNQMGVINPSTWKTVDDASSLKSIRVVVGSPNDPRDPSSPVGFEDPFNVKTSYKSMEIKAVNDFYTVAPQEARTFIGYYGYNGINDCKTLTFECGETAEFEVKVQGSIVERLYGQFEVFERFSVNTDCCPDADCTDGCDTAVDCGKVVDALVKTMNDSRQGQNKIARFGKFSAVKTCDTPVVVTTYAFKKWYLTVPDNGNGEALDAVKYQYPSYSVTRVDRNGINSIYEIVIVDGVTPTDFTPTSNIQLAVCTTCPTGYTYTVGGNVYKVTRPITPSTDLSTSGARQTYADTIGTAYEAATAVTFAGTIAGVTVGTDTITATAHGFLTGDKVVYNNGGGTSITGLTSTNTYYVIKTGTNTLQLASSFANAIAGTEIDLTVVGVGVAHTLTPVITATFISNNEGTASVQLTTPEGVELTALLSDVTTLVNVLEPTCVPTAASAIAWVVQTDVLYKIRRKLCMTIKNDDCDETNVDLLAEIKAFYTNDEFIVNSTIAQTTNGDCNSLFEMYQYSANVLEDGCDTTAYIDAQYVEPQAFNGVKWEECPCATITYDDGCTCGIKVESFLGTCDFAGCGYDPTEFKEYDTPVFEIYQVGKEFDCAEKDPAWFVAQRPRVEMLDGHRVIQEILLYRQYRHEDYTSPSTQYAQKFIEAEGLRHGVDPCAKYYVLHLLGEYGNISSTSIGFGDALEDIQLFFEDRNMLEDTIALLSTFTSRPMIDVAIRYED